MAGIEIRDAIHTRITLSEREREVLDHPYVQRLRHIRQLGFVPLVYPSATHDRFSHSLGTMHLAGRLAETIFTNDSVSILARTLGAREKKFLASILRLAGLLHDVGHAPFSHSAELAMPQVSSLALPRTWMKNPRDTRAATHEDYSALLIAGMAEGSGAVLTPDEAAIIASLVHHKKIHIPPAWNKALAGRQDAGALHGILRSLISSNIDADRMDYLLRDAHFTGVPYGNFDLDWLISTIGVITYRGEYTLAIAESSIHALEHFLFARAHMYAQVYMHKTAKCFEYFFQQALAHRELAYAIPADREAFVQLRDSTLTEELFQAAQKNPSSWAGRLMARAPAKRIARITDNPREAQKLYRALSRALAPKKIRIFLCSSHKSFLETRDSRAASVRGRQGIFLSDLAAVPLAVVRDQTGVRTAASLADHSSLLVQYQRDIRIDDIYIMPEDYALHRGAITDAMKKHRVLAPSEIILED